MNKNLFSARSFLMRNHLFLKRSGLLFSFLLLLLISSSASLSAQCERISNGVFPAPVTPSNTNTIAGWTVGGTYPATGPWSEGTNPGRVYISTNGLEFRRDAGTLTTLQQNLTGIRPSSTINISGLYWYKTGQPTDARGVLTVSYNGVIYATIDTTTGNTPAITVSNNAKIDRTVLPTIAGTGISTPVNVNITLPDSILSSGTLLFSFQAGPHPDAGWDIGMKSVSIVNAPPATPTITTTAASCTAAASNFVTNYDSALTYTSFPAGLSVGAGGAITGGTNGTAYSISSSSSVGCSSAASATFTRSIGAQLASTAITSEPTATQRVCQNGSSTTLSVSATGANLTYQWYSNTANSTSTNGRTAIAGATGSTFTPPTTTVGTLYYHVIVTGCSSSTSKTSTVIVNTNTVITSQPATTLTACQGTTASALSVSTTGAASRTYQWYRNENNNVTNGTAISGATAASYAPPTTTIGTVYYYVVVTGCDSKPSSTSAVTVNPTTSITTQPAASQTICQGGTVSPLSVSAAGTALTYQWYRNTVNSNSGGTKISNATGSSYTPLSTTTGTTYYYVVVSGTCGTAVNSSVSTVIVNSPTTISTQPLGSQTVCQDAAPTNLSVVATGSDSLTYQWFSNNSNSNSGGTAISGATASSYKPETTALGTRYYYVEVKGCKTVSSAVSTVTVAASPVITAQPYAAQTVKPGVAPSDISVVATGTNLSYQWYNAGANNSTTGGSIIANATSSSYTPPSSSIVGTTYYYAVISGGCTPLTTSTSAVQVACSEEIVYNKGFSYTGGQPQTMTFGPMSNGLVFDVFTLDNSFTLNINGTNITSQEIEFQTAGTATGINVRFADGTNYEGTTPSIFNMRGTESNPIVRVVISKEGKVSLFGAKNTGQRLLPLVLLGENKFNSVSLSSTDNNTLILSQAVVGPTLITGRIYAVKTIPCVCYNDPNTLGTAAPTQHGITLLKRAGAGTNDNWPMVRKGAHTALESNTKGFVITRIPTTGFSAITSPVEGMMVYDTTENCLKIYEGTGWKCFSTPSCP